MITDEISKLVDEAHAIFNATSVFEVIDLDKHAARDFLAKAYGNPDIEAIDRYLDVLKKLDCETRTHFPHLIH